jgi:molybdopterin-binding protein
MKISARNNLKGTVKSVVLGPVNAEIVVELPGGAEITSIITKNSAERLDIKEGKEVRALIKASAVILATD